MKLRLEDVHSSKMRKTPILRALKIWIKREKNNKNPTLLPHMSMPMLNPIRKMVSKTGSVKMGKK